MPLKSKNPLNTSLTKVIKIPSFKKFEDLMHKQSEISEQAHFNLARRSNSLKTIEPGQKTLASF